MKSKLLNIFGLSLFRCVHSWMKLLGFVRTLWGVLSSGLKPNQLPLLFLLKPDWCVEVCDVLPFSWLFLDWFGKKQTPTLISSSEKKQQIIRLEEPEPEVICGVCWKSVRKDSSMYQNGCYFYFSRSTDRLNDRLFPLLLFRPRQDAVWSRSHHS